MSNLRQTKRKAIKKKHQFLKVVFRIRKLRPDVSEVINSTCLMFLPWRCRSVRSLLMVCGPKQKHWSWNCTLLPVTSKWFRESLCRSLRPLHSRRFQRLQETPLLCSWSRDRSHWTWQALRFWLTHQHLCCWWKQLQWSKAICQKLLYRSKTKQWSIVHPSDCAFHYFHKSFCQK